MSPLRRALSTLMMLVVCVIASQFLGLGTASAAPPVAPCDPRTGCVPNSCDPRTGCVDLGPVNPPTNLQANAPEDGTVVLTWTRPAPKIATSGSAIHIASFTIFRDGQNVATVNTTPNPSDRNQVNPTTWTDLKPPQGRSLSYLIKSVDDTGRSSAASAAANVKPVQLLPGAAPPAAGTTSGSPTGTTDIAQPDFKGSNSKTSFEEYGSGIGNIHNTYGNFDQFIELKMIPVTLFWSMLTFMSYLSLTQLAWTVTTQVYKGVVLAVTAVVQIVFALPIYDSLLHLVMTVAGISIVILVLRQYMARVRRALTYIAVALLVTTVYTLFAPAIVQKVMTMPVTIGQAILGYTNELANYTTGHPELAENRFNVSIKPTYNGNPFEQGVRRYQDAEFLNTVYSAECALNFGGQKWSTTQYVPNRQSPAAAGYDHLTYCEYYIRAEVYGNTTEMDYLSSTVESNAPSKVWEAFQGKDVGGHYANFIFIGPALAFRTILNFLLGYVFAVCIFTLGYFLVKMTFVLLAGMVPYWSDVLGRAAKLMVIKFALPPAMAAALVLGLVFSTIGYNTVNLLGWAGMMVFQMVSGFASMTAGFMLFKASKRKEKEIDSEKQPLIPDRLRGRRDTDDSSVVEGKPSVSPSPRHGAQPGVMSRAGSMVAAVSTVGVGTVVARTARTVASRAGHAVVERGSDRWQRRQQDMSDSGRRPSTGPGANRRNVAAGKSGPKHRA